MFFTLSDFQSLVVAKGFVTAGDDTFAGFQSLGDFVVLRILATDADGATEGGVAVLAEDVDPCASRLLEEGAAGDEHCLLWLT